MIGLPPMSDLVHGAAYFSGATEFFAGHEGAAPGYAYSHVGWGPGSVGFSMHAQKAGLPAAQTVLGEGMTKGIAGKLAVSGILNTVVAPIGLTWLTGGSFSDLPSVFLTDLATNTALVRHHFMPAVKAGNLAKTGQVAPGLMSAWMVGGDAGVSMGVRAMNTASYAFKYTGGSLGGALGGSIGGAVTGGIASMLGFNGGLQKTAYASGYMGGTFAGAYAGAGVASAIATPVGLTMTGVAAMGLIGSGLMAGGAYYGLVKPTYKLLQQGYNKRRNQRGIDTSGDLAAFYTQGAMTMRARAVQAIQKSHLNARSALGQEANFMHMPSRNYHSKYRTVY